MDIKVKPKTYVAIVLDSSGSMVRIAEEAVQGYNEQIQQQKLRSKDQEILCSLVTFNGDVFEHHWCVPPTEIAEAKQEDFKPDGSTAFRDAVGYTIQKLLDTTDPKEPNVAYLVVVISDGKENASEHYKEPGKLARLIDSVEETGKWTITYMGCSKEYVKQVAAETGIKIQNTAGWSNKSKAHARYAMHQNTQRQNKFWDARLEGLVQCNDVYSDVGGACADFSNDLEVANFAAANPVDLSTKVVPAVDALLINTNESCLQPFSNANKVNWVETK